MLNEKQKHESPMEREKSEKLRTTKDFRSKQEQEAERSLFVWMH